MTSPDRPRIPTATGAMLERTRRRAEQLRRQRRVLQAAVATAVVAVAVPLVLVNADHRGHVLRTVGEPTSLSVALTTPANTAQTAQARPSVTPPMVVTTPTTRPDTSTSIVAIKECATSHLKASLNNPSGAAGSVGYNLVLVNISAVTCSLGGFPGLSYVTDASGPTVGAPAQRDNLSPIVTVTLAPGHAVRATLIEVNSLNYPPDTCRLTPVNGLRIYPPNQTVALFLPQSTQACANPADPVLKIGPVRAVPAG